MLHLPAEIRCTVNKRASIAARLKLRSPLIWVVAPRAIDSVRHYAQSVLQRLGMKVSNDFDMDVIGVLAGTDKSSSGMFSWDYLRHYQEAFAPWRDANINLIEIGVQGGPSIEVWLAYFSKAVVVGVDIDARCKALARDRVVIEIGSQDDPGFLHRVCAVHPPTILIDDGSHQAHHMIYTFERLFPVLLPGGVYVIEDLEFQFGKYGTQYSGDGSVNAPRYFQTMAEALMAREPGEGQKWGTGRYIFDNLDSITFVRGAVIIRKKKALDINGALKFARGWIADNPPTPDALARLANYIVFHHGTTEEAERYVRRALNAGGPTPFVMLALTNVLIRQGRMEEALAEARKAVESDPQDRQLWERLAWIEGQFGNQDEAAAASERVASLR